MHNNFNSFLYKEDQILGLITIHVTVGYGIERGRLTWHWSLNHVGLEPQWEVTELKLSISRTETKQALRR